jgi:superfamily I DNA/RNA helicase
MNNRNYEPDSVLTWRFTKNISQDNPQVHYLGINYRSFQEILDFASAIRNDGEATPQEAARGSREEKPAIIRVNNIGSLSQPDIPTTIRAMVDAALQVKKSLPPSDTGTVAFMAAHANLSRIIQDYLKAQDQSFSVQERSSYQSWHVKQVLAYYRLIMDRHQHAEMVQLLYHCIPQLVKALETIAQQNGQSLFDVLMNGDVLAQIALPSEQEEVLRQHLAIIHTFTPDSCFIDVWQAVSELPDGPLVSVAEEKQKNEELASVLEDLKQKKTVAEAMKHVNKYIAFVEEDRPDQPLVVTTVDHAKSQAFDTVFLLGAHLLYHRNNRKRWYVSVSRARNRFFFLVCEQCQETATPLSWLPEKYYDEVYFPDLKRSKNP